MTEITNILSLSLFTSPHLDEGVFGDDDGSTMLGIGIASWRNLVTASGW